MKKFRTFDWLGSVALVTALVATASAEYELARAVGFDAITAGCVPAALDVYALRAFAAKRDVLAVVLALIATNALAHLVSAGVLAVSVPLIIGVSAIAPIVIWRMKTLHASTSALDAPVSAPEAARGPMPLPDPVGPSEAPSAAQPEPEAPQPEPEPVQPTDPLLPDAQRMHLDAGKMPTLRALQSELRIGQARAQRIRAELSGAVA